MRYEKYFDISFVKKILKHISRLTNDIKCRFLILYRINIKSSYVYICDQKKILMQYPAIEAFDKSSDLVNGKFTKETAAIIFNSAIHNFSGLGSEIDRNDIVIRINFGTGKFKPEDLGQKTTIRVLGRDWIYHDHDEIIGRTYNSPLYYEKDKQNISQCPDVFKNGLFVFDDDAMKCYRSLFGGMMSNGMRSVLLGLALARKVTIYGADTESALPSAWAPTNDRHYPNNQLKDYFCVWSENKNIINDVDKYFNNLNGVTGHNTHLEYLFYKLHPRVIISR